MTATATSFPLSKHTGGCDTAPAFSGLRVYLQFTWELGLPPPPVEFSFHCHFYKLSGSWLLGVCHCSCLLQPACSEGFPLLCSSALGVPRPLCFLSFLLLLLITQFFFSFYPWWGLVCPGGCADLAQDYLWEYCMLLSSPCGPPLPKPSGCCHLAVVWESSWFLRLTWSGDAMRRLEVWRSQSFGSSWYFFLYSVSPACLQVFTLGGTLSASSL
jgi:hypothetical protein